MTGPRQIARPLGGWSRRPLRYQPVYRSPGLRHLPNEPVGLAFICSLLFHAALIFALVLVTESPPWSRGADVALLGAADLVPSPPVDPGATDRSSPVRHPGRGHPAATLPPASTIRAGARSSTPPRQPDPQKATAIESRGIASLPAPQVSNSLLPSQTAEPGKAATPESPVNPKLDGPVALLFPQDLDRPLDAGPPETPPASAGTEDPAPAKVLTPVPVLAGSAVGEPLLTQTAWPALAPASTPVQDEAQAPTKPSPPLAMEVREQGAISGPARGEASPAQRAASPSTRTATPPTTRPVQPVPAGSSRRAAAESTAEARPTSPLGLGLGQALVQFEGPRDRVTDRPIETISGKLLGARATRFVLYVNGVPTEVEAAERAFAISVPMQPGSNSLRAVVTGPTGLEAEDAITVEYMGPTASDGIVLTNPADGLILGPEDPPVVVIEGQVDDKAVTTVWIVANDRRVPAATQDGRFRQILPVSDPVIRLWAEALSNGGPTRRSQTVTVRNGRAGATAGVLVMQWPRGAEGLEVDVSATWRARPDRLDAPVQTQKLPAYTKATGGAPSEIFHLPGLKPGVYTLAVRYRGTAPPGDVRSTLFLPHKTGLIPRVLGPVRLNGGRTVLTKILMPYGILWSQDEWFSGMSESVDTVTKFRIPEGVSWVERKGDLP